jgi:hypothetical protein
MYFNIDDATPLDTDVLELFAPDEIWAVECSNTNIIVVTFNPTTMEPQVFATSSLGLCLSNSEKNCNDWNVFVLASKLFPAKRQINEID